MVGVVMDSTIRYRMPVNVPDGTYDGKWGGYRLVWQVDGNEVDIQTKIGVRGINIPVRFSVIDGKVDQDSIKVIGD